MADRRIAYVVLLAALTVLFLFYEAFLSWYLLLAALLCPVLSLVLSLPAMVRATVAVQVPETVLKGQPCAVAVKVSCPSVLPFGRLSFAFSMEDQAGHGVLRHKQYSLSGFGGTCLQLSVPTDHCGVLTASVSGARVTDLLGLFSRKLPVEVPSMTLVLPIPAEPDALPPLPETGPLVVKPGGGFAEDYELRDYRPGDTVRSIHWKLSAKTDDLVVRDALVPQNAQCQIVLAFGGMPEQVDRTLAHLVWVSTWLTEQEVPHCVSWYDSRNQVQSRTITNHEGLDALVRTLLLDTPPEVPRYPAVDQGFCLDGEGAAL
jgi:uncharacterized protein (DUF58 family)